MDAHLKAANHALDHAVPIPPLFYKGCSGILLLQGAEGGLGISIQGGKGILIRHNHGKGWSSPVAISYGSVGAGGVIGFAEKDIIIFLNPAGMKRMVEGKGQIKLNEDIGIAVGPVGAAAASEIGVSDKGGWATSFAFTIEKGALINVEVTGQIVEADGKPNQQVYGTTNAADIIEGKVSAPANAKVDEIMSKIDKKMK